MLNYLAKSFAELATPLSRNKLFLLVEIFEPDQANQIDFYPLFLRGLRMDGASSDVMDSLNRGFLVAEAEISDQNREIGLSVVDFFRQAKIRDIAKVYLFANEQLVEHSHDGLPSIYDLVAELPPPCYSIKPIF
ncbi:MAG: hypothetical protein P4N41_16170 [Negativicutes bacterium]|nr:hypothetical protein [Negativicutes bacterium]MDR3591189.1 hypothetical protein [Negativicutes bacterium]